MEDIGSKFDKFLTAYSVDMKLLMENSGKEFYNREKLIFHKSSIEPSIINDKKVLERRARAILIRSGAEESRYTDTNVSFEEYQTSEDDERSIEEKARLRKLRKQQEIISKQINDTLKTLRKNKIIYDQELSNNEVYFCYNNFLNSKDYFDHEVKKSNLKHHNTKQLADHIDRLYKLCKSDSSRSLSKKSKKLKSMMKKYLLYSIKDKNLNSSQFRLQKFKSEMQLNQISSHQKRLSLNIRVNLNAVELNEKSNADNVKKKVQISQNFSMIEPHKDFECSIANENECAAKASSKTISSSSLGEKEYKIS